MNNALHIMLKDDYITLIDTDDEYYNGCETCDYGSAYINTITIFTTTKEICIEVTKMYDYTFSVGNAILIFNSPELVNVAQEELGKWLEEKIRRLHDPMLSSLEGLEFKHHIRDRRVQ